MTVEDTIERVARAMHDWCERQDEHWPRKPNAWEEIHETAKQEMRETVLALLSSLRPGDDLGNGLVAVPKEPTRAMVDAGKHAPAWDVQETIWSSDADGEWVSPAPVKMYPAYVYRDMIAAASLPAPPVTKQEEGE